MSLRKGEQIKRSHRTTSESACSQGIGPNFCSICGSTEKLLRCGRCRMTVYCSKEHQVSDWKNHKKNCFPVTEAKSKGPSRPSPHSHFDPSAEVSLADDATFYPVSLSTRNIQRSDQDIPDEFAMSYPYKTMLKPRDHHGSKTEDLEHRPVVQERNQGLAKSKKTIKRRNTLEKWTLPITSEGSSEDTIRGTAEQTLNPVVENSKMLNSSGASVARVPAKVQNGTRQHKANIDQRDGNALGKHASFLHLSQSNLEKLNVICQNVIADLNSYGVCVVDNFLGPERGHLVLDEVLNIYNAGLFTDGQLVSTKAGSNDSKNIRGDQIIWLDGKESHCPNIGMLISQVDAIIMRSNKMKNNGKMGTYTITGRTKAMVACYPGCGAHYVKHVDNPNRDGRCITAIYYLNKDWEVKESGGLLRIFPDGWRDQVADIEPIFDRILFFWSDRRNPHEVQPAYKTRYAITLWYFDSEERNEAYKRYQKENENRSTAASNTENPAQEKT